MCMKRYITATLFALVLTLSGGRVWAQATGHIAGTVIDTSGAAVPDAKVTLISQGTAIERTAQTDASGTYIIALVPVGFYTIRVEKPQFKTAETTDITRQEDENREVDFTLSLGQTNEQVQVSAYPVSVNTTDATVGQVITSEQVADLPLNGRDLVELATLGPGHHR